MRRRKPRPQEARLSADPNIEGAGISVQGNIWARFIDGTLYQDYAGREADFNEVRKLPGTPKKLDLPRTRTAVLGLSVEPGWHDITPTLGGWLTSQKYDLSKSPAEFTHQELEAMRDVGVFFWQTHAGQGFLREQLRDASGAVMNDDKGRPRHKTAFMYTTSTVVAKGIALTADQDKMLNEKLLAVTTVSLEFGKPERYQFRLGITAEFIKERMKSAFATNALVVINGCGSADPGAVAAFKEVHAGAFVGWEPATGNPFDANSGSQAHVVFERLFDRLLGQNVARTAGVPLERPFHFDAVKSWMQRKGYDIDKASPKAGGFSAKLAFFSFTDFAILRPTISRLGFRGSSVAAPFPRLYIEGTFGEDPGVKGSVHWGSTPLTIVKWLPNEIEVRVPSGPPYPTEPVFVKIDERESNPARFTLWSLPLTYTLTGRGSLSAVVTFNCLLRADVRGNRFEPEEVPVVITNNASYLLDSSGTVMASGSATAPTETWSGGASLSPLPLDQSPAPATNYVSCGGTINGTTRQVTLLPGVQATFNKNNGAGGFINSIIGFQTGIVIDVDWPTRALKAKSVTSTTWPIPTETLVVSWPGVIPVAGTAPVDADPR